MNARGQYIKIMMLMTLAGGVSTSCPVAADSRSYRDIEKISASQTTQTKPKNYEWWDLDFPPISTPNFANSLLEFLVSRRVGEIKRGNLIKIPISYSFGKYCFLSAIERQLLYVHDYTTFSNDESRRLATKIAQCGLIVYTFVNKNGKMNFMAYYAAGNDSISTVICSESQVARLRITALPYNADDEKFELLAKNSAEIGAQHEEIH